MKIFSYKTKKNLKAGLFLGDLVNKSKYIIQEQYQTMHNIAYANRERQLQSIITPAIYELCNAVFLEKSTYRSKDDYGWIDYLCLYKDDYIFLVELKHAYNNIKSEELDKDIREKWEEVVEQINSINSENNEIKDFTEYKKDKIYKIALLVVTDYEKVKSKNSEIDLAEDETFNQVNENKGINYDMFSTIQVGNIINEEFDCEGNGKQKFPNLHFIAKIEKLT